jgi:small-conductance mechanosensitive channel
VILVAVGLALRVSTALLHRLLRVDDPRRPPERAATIRTLVPLLESALRYVLYFVAIVMILDRLHFNVAALLASAGIAGIAIGFGAQHFIRDIISGFFLLFEGVVQVGDAVRIGDVTGEVERVTLRTTQIRQFSGELVTIPNGDIGRLANMNRGFMRALVVATLPSAAPLERALEVMRRTAEAWAAEHPQDVLGPPEVQGIIEWGTAELRVRLAVMVRPGLQADAERALRRRLLEAFEAEGIMTAAPVAASPAGAPQDTMGAQATVPPGPPDVPPKSGREPASR